MVAITSKSQIFVFSSKARPRPPADETRVSHAERDVQLLQTNQPRLDRFRGGVGRALDTAGRNQPRRRKDEKPSEKRLSAYPSRGVWQMRNSGGLCLDCSGSAQRS
mgnify:CR=1 FL=1